MQLNNFIRCLVRNRYHEIFFMIDTCQAASMYEKFYSPNILAMASSLVGEDSLSVVNLIGVRILIQSPRVNANLFTLQHHVDPAIGVYIIDRYTFYALKFLEKVRPDSSLNMSSFVRIGLSSGFVSSSKKTNCICLSFFCSWLCVPNKIAFLPSE